MRTAFRRRGLLMAVIILALAGSGIVPTAAAVSADAPLYASCTVSPSTATVGENVTLNASSTDASFVEFNKFGGTEYPISDPDGDFIVTVSYADPETYQPSVRADGDSANTESCGSLQVVVNQSPNASFTTQPQPAIAGETVEFNASKSSDSDGEIVAYYWDFNGDEQYEVTTSQPTVTHTYSENGTYRPILRVEDGDGASGFDSQAVEVVEPQNESPTASFTYRPQPGVTGQDIEFNATQSTDPDGDILEYWWSFDGDSQVDASTTEPTVNRSYAESGFKNVILQVVDDQNATGFTSRDVEVVQPANEPPEASFTYDPQPGVAGQPITFDASASADPDGQIGTYQWDFDGDRVVDQTTTDPVIQHTFAETGFKTVALQVRDGDNASDVTSRDVEVVEPQNESPEASFSYDPEPGIAGQPVTFDASASEDPDGSIDTYEWDFDGDGVFDQSTTGPAVERTFTQSGFQNVALRVVDDANATGFTSRDVEVVEPTIQVGCTVEPTTVAPGEDVTITVGESANVSYLDYDVDGDGEFDRFETRERTLTTSYEEPGTYTPTVRLYSGTGSRKIVECGPVTVEERNEPPIAEFTISPADPSAGERVTFDASNSTDPDGQIISYEWDFDGDGVVDETTTGPAVTHTYDDTGDIVPRLIVDDSEATDETVRDLTVESPIETPAPTTDDRTPTTDQPITITAESTPTTTPSQSEDESDLPPWWPIPAGGAGLLGLGGLGYYLFGGSGTGGGSGGGDSDPKPKPKPRPDVTKKGARYETGVFALPTESGSLSVPLGFEPDLLLFSAGNGARTDTATDRTAGWTRGLAHRTGDGIENQCLTVADDAHATDQATCAFDDEAAVQLVRHEAAGPPGRVSATVSNTTSDGFEVDVSVPGDDPLAGGIRVLYQAIRTGADADVAAGTVMTPTEPGTQTLDLGIDADHVSLSVSAAVADTDQLWTTDRGVGVSVGHATAEPDSAMAQGVAGTSAWPGTGHPTAGVGDDTSLLHLLYQDGDRLAGRTRASATAIGETLRLQYDRVYNGPHKLGSTASHPLSYLAVAGGETMRPAVGTFPLPRPGETRTVECGFEPALIELQIAPAPLGEEIALGATPQPFGWSQGTAIATGDRLRQYVLHHAVVPEQPDVEVSGTATDAPGAGTGRASTDGGRIGDSPAAGTSTVPEMDVQPLDPETPATSRSNGETRIAPAAPEHDDDGLAGLWLATAAHGTVVGRDELRVSGITETGFDASVESIDTDRRNTAGPRPTVVYRAWPAVDVTRSAGEPSSNDGQANTDREPAKPEVESANSGPETMVSDIESPTGDLEAEEPVRRSHTDPTREDQ